jgi:hypothetical protein
VARMKAEGFASAVVVETSAGNFQAWLQHGEVLPKELSTAVARALAEKFGGGVRRLRTCTRCAGECRPRCDRHARSIEEGRQIDYIDRTLGKATRAVQDGKAR